MKHSTITDLDATVRDLLARHGRLRVEIASLSRFDDLTPPVSRVTPASI